MSYIDDDGVKRSSRGEWHMSMDGITETRVNFGRSAEGFHFQIERSRLGGDSEPGWSRAYRTAEAAERVASAREWGTNPDREESPRQQFRDRVEKALEQRGQSPSGAAAAALESAAFHRQTGRRDQARTAVADARLYRKSQRDSIRVVERKPAQRYHPDQQRNVRIVMGRSAEGHHFRIEQPSGEASAAARWSRSYDTPRDASRAAYGQVYSAPESQGGRPAVTENKLLNDAPRAGLAVTETRRQSGTSTAEGAGIVRPAAIEPGWGAQLLGRVRERVSAIGAGVRAYFGGSAPPPGGRGASAEPAAGVQASSSKRSVTVARPGLQVPVPRRPPRGRRRGRGLNQKAIGDGLLKLRRLL